MVRVMRVRRGCAASWLRRARAGALALLAAAALAGCGDVTAILTTFDAGAGPTVMPPRGGSDAASPEPGATDAALGDGGLPASSTWAELEPGPRDAFCAGRGPAIRARSASGAGDCPPGVGRRLFGRALCACSELSIEGPRFSSDGFDSRSGPYPSGAAGATLGVNGALRAGSGEVTIGDSLLIHGDAPLALAGVRLLVRGDLRTRAAIDVSSGSLEVGRDLWAGGALRIASAASASVARDLYQPAGAAVDGALALGGAARTGSTGAEPPCACDPESRLDVAALVAQARVANDNLEAGVASDAFDGAPNTMFGALPCGRFYFRRIAVPIGTIVFTAPGRTAWFVDGDFAIAGTSQFDVGPSGELDVFVAGNLDLQVTNILGNAERPAAVRFYVAGRVELAGITSLAAQIYAPRAAFGFELASEGYGAVFADRITTRGEQVLHYDHAIAAAGERCEPPPPAP